jgi:hypothetical protein
VSTTRPHTSLPALPLSELPRMKALLAGETQTCVESHRDRITALGRARELAGEQHRVFLAYSDGRSSTLIDCTDIARRATIATR